MTIYSSDNSILVQNPDDCVFELRINPLTSTQPPIFVEDTTTVDMGGDGSVSNKIKGTVKVSSLSGNSLQSLNDGLFVPTVSNQSITLSGDISGSGTTSINTTLNNTGVTPGTYNSVTVNSQGRVTSATNISNQPPLTLTTSGTSGTATFSSNVLNIPNYTYTLPITSGSVLGGMKLGNGLSVNISGAVSVNNPMVIDGTILNANIEGGVLFQSSGLLKQNSNFVFDQGNLSLYINSVYNSRPYMTCINTDAADSSGSNNSICIGIDSNNGVKNKSIFLGNTSGSSVVSVTESIGIGTYAGARINGASVRTYSKIISIGNYSNSDSFFNISNSVAIGNHVGNTSSNQINLGNCVYVLNICNVTNGVTSSTYTAQVNPLVGIGTDAPTSGLDINTQFGYNPIRVRKTYTPTSSSDTIGDVGTICFDDNYIYKKTSAGWTRSAIFTTF